MKQHYIENQAKNQIQQSIKDALTGSNQTTKQERCNKAMPKSPLDFSGGRGEAFARGYGKGPPGRSRSPGEASHLFPEHPPDNCTANETHLKTNLKPIPNSIKVRQRAEIHLNTESQIVIKTQFLQPFKFFIMKKQILFLAMFTLALIFAGTNKSYGQTGTPLIANGVPASYVNVLSAAPTCITPTPLTCGVTADATHPQAGILYTYNVTVNDVGARIHWFVTTQTNIMVALNNITGTAVDPVNGSYVLSAGTVTGNAAYNVNTNTVNTIDITWKSFNGATTPVLLVTYVVNAAGCTDNIEVYRIMPVFNFTLDISALSAAGVPVSGTAAADCVSPIESATYTTGTPGTLTMNYGENWVYFIVNAANFANSWMPKFRLAYTGTVGDALELQWAYPTDALANTAWKTTTGAGGIFTGTTPVNAVSAAIAGSNVGECIIVRVRVDHGPNENIVAQTVTLAVNGTMFDPAAASGSEYASTDLVDLGNAAVSGDPCVRVDYDDETIFTLNPRPDIISNTGTGPLPFLIKD